MRLITLSTGSKGNCLLLEHDNRYVILDCGVAVDKILEAVDFDIRKIDVCLVSHSHNDHALSARKMCDMFINTVMSRQTAFELNISDKSPTLKIMGTEQMAFGEWIIRPFELEHDVKNLGYIIYNKIACKKTVYISDTGFIRHLIPDTDYLIVEANFIDDLLDVNDDNIEQKLRIKKNHMGLTRLLSYIGKIDKTYLSHIVLVHLSATNSDSYQIQREVSAYTGTLTTIAEDNSTIYLEREGF